MKTWVTCVLLSWIASPAMAETITVRAGADLQSALDRAKSGDTIELEPRATFTGHYTLPAKDGTAVTTLRTATRADTSRAVRLSPADAAAFAKLQTPDNQPALQTAPGAHHWRITLVEVLGANDGDLVALGDARPQTSPSQVPHDLIVDRVYVHGDPVLGRRRGISLNSASTTITNSYISDIKAVARDAQALCGWNGPGPFTITNNYLEASTENVLFGGGDPSIANLVPADITITGNTLAKPERWRQERWEVKNLLELKNARHVVIRDNTLEYNWQQAQVGFAVLFTVRNQDGGCPWCEVSDVVFENNVVRHSSAGVSILGVDNNHPSKQTRGIVIRNNVFDLDNQRWGGSGYAFLITNGPRDITIDRNTVIQDHGAGFLQVDGPQIPGFVFTNNIVRHNEYGVAGTARAPGKDALDFFFPGARFSGNAIADGDPSRYPSGNEFPSLQELCKAMISCESHDYRLKPDVKWRGVGAQTAAN